MGDTRARGISPRKFAHSTTAKGAWANIVSSLYSEYPADEGAPEISAVYNRTITFSRASSASVGINAVHSKTINFSRTSTASIGFNAAYRVEYRFSREVSGGTIEPSPIYKAVQFVRRIIEAVISLFSGGRITKSRYYFMMRRRR